MKNAMRRALAILLLMPFAAFSQAVDVPHPVLDEFKPEVRAMLAGARGRFELMALQAEGQQLGVAYGRLGVHYYAHAIQDAARACFQNAAALDPQNHRWPYYLGVHYAETGNFAAAAEQLRKVLAIMPGDVPAMTRLGQALIELGQAGAAEEQFSAVLDAAGEDAPALAGMARVAEERGAWRDAADYYNRALASQPEATQLHYRLGQVYRQLGDVDKARTHLGQRGDRIPSISDPLLQFMDAHTRPAGYYVALGSRALGAEDINTAWKYYDVAYAIDPTHVGAIAGMARVRLLTGEVEKARSLADTALRLRRDDPAALQVRGMVSEVEGDREAAMDLYRASLALADHPQTRFMLAHVLAQQGEYEQAREQYAKIAAGDNAGAEVKYRLGMLHIALGDCVAAEPELLAAYEMDQGMVAAIEALARVYSTCLEASDEQRDTALDYAQMMYDGSPGLQTAETLAMIMAAKQRYDDAVDFQAQAIFEALKSGALEREPQLKQNMERYRNQQPAGQPWPPGHAVFSGR